MANQEISFEDFLMIDICVGTILTAKKNLKTKFPSYELSIYFENEIGNKTSST